MDNIERVCDIDDPNYTMNGVPKKTVRNNKGQFVKGYAPIGSVQRYVGHKTKSTKEKKEQVDIERIATIKRLRTRLKILRQKYDELSEYKLSGNKELMQRVRVLQKDPKYYWTVVGLPVLQIWKREQKLNLQLATVLIICSYYQMILRSDFALFKVRVFEVKIKQLIEMGLMQSIDLPKKTPKGRPRKGYFLTPNGHAAMDRFKVIFNENTHLLNLDDEIASMKRFAGARAKIKQKKIKNALL